MLEKIFNLINKIKRVFFPFYKDKELKFVFQKLQEGFPNDKIAARFVGGCVRKYLSNDDIDDIDIATTLSSEEIKERFNNTNFRVVDTGIEHGTITLVSKKHKLEITTLRKDVETDGRHAEVIFTKDWKEDSIRRDFTINSIYADIDGNLFDPNNGVEDLQNGTVRFIGNSYERIQEDYLRILRYIRFFLLYSKKDHSSEIKKTIKQNISGVSNLSKERLLDELNKIFKSRALFKLVKDNFSYEIISLIFPQLINLKILKKLEKKKEEILINKSFDFLLALLIIDETDNADYFLYKFNLSNDAKNRIKFLKSNFEYLKEKDFFSKENLEKIFYYNNKSSVIDLIDFELIKTNTMKKKLIELKNYFQKKEKPVFPIKAKSIMEKFDIKEGRELGQKLKNLENIWVNNSFSISDKEIEKTFSN